MALSAQEVRFAALRNAIYHTGARRRLEALNRFMTLLVIVLGTAAAAQVSKYFGVADMWIGGAVAFIGALQLVFDFGNRARSHELLQRRYYDLMADVDSTMAPTDDQVAAWNGVLTRIYGEETPEDPIAMIDAYNIAATTSGAEFEARIRVPLWARILGIVLPMHHMHFPTFGERKGRSPEAAQSDATDLTAVH